MATETLIYHEEQLQGILAQVSFKNTVLDFKWKFHVRPFYEAEAQQKGWLIHATFERPDTDTGVTGVGRGRDEIILRGSSEFCVVKTCWVLVEMLVKHELMEGFRYQDYRIFDPHHTVQDLMVTEATIEKMARRGLLPVYDETKHPAKR